MKASLLKRTAFLAAMIGAAKVQGAVLYSVEDIGTVNGSTRSEARGITSLGAVWGENFNTDYPYFFWLKGTNSGIAKLKEASAMSLYGMNEIGQFAGFTSFAVSSRNYAFVGSPYSPIPLATNFSPRGVNYDGVVAGVTSIRVETFPGSGVLVLVNRPAVVTGQQMVILPSLAGSNVWLNAEATAINDSGVVVGWSGTSSNVTHSFLWDGTMHDLHTLGTRSNSVASAINNTGMVAGNMYNFTSSREPFLWTSSNGMAALTLPGGYSTGQPLGLNNRGDVVGVAGSSSAVLWTNGGMTDLQNVIPTSPSWDLDGAYGINDAGEICGYGKNGGLTKAFVLHPTNMIPAQFNVELLDPGDPSSTNALTGTQVTTNTSILNALGTRRFGLAADGVSRLVVRVNTTNQGAVSLSLRTADGATGVSGIHAEDGDIGSVGGTTGLDYYETSTVTTAQGIRAYALYRAPDIFHRTNNTDSIRVQRVINMHAVFTPESGPTVTQSVKMVIVRPPLVVMHGVWSDRTQSFAGFERAFRIAEAGVQIFGPSYPNSTYFRSNANVLPDEIRADCAAFRQQNFACTRVDVFGHSMGGVLSRIYAGSTGIYKRADNYQRGDINRLVTIDSPHRGSFIADGIDEAFSWLAQNNLGDVRVALIVAMNGAGMPPLNGAGYDLTTFSAEITHMNQHATDVAAHVIVGDFTLSGNLTDLPNPLGGFYKALNKYAALELADTYFQPIPDSDLVVSADSQEAGLFGQNSCSVFNHQHIGAANVTNVLLKCLSLYLKPPSHNWYSKGFPTGWSATPQPPAPPPANSPATYQNSSLLLLASGSNATAGFTASLSVSEPAGTNFSSVLLLASGSAVEDTNAPFDFTVTIPWEAIGNYPVSYLAVDTYSNTWWGTNMLFVTPFAGLASLRWMEVEPRRYIFTRPNAERQITVTGVYLDVLRNITDPSTTTTYSSADTNVVTVSTNGLMRAHNNGTSQITISNNGKTAYVDITVALLPAPDLALNQTVSATNVPANMPVTFTLRVTNIGPLTASAVYLVDALPLDAQLQSATTSQGDWSYTNGFFAAELGSLAPGGSATATLTVIFTDGGAHLCTATTSAVGVDANDLDNEASVVVSVNAQPVLAIRQETTNVIVSWLTNAGAFVLERTPDLAPTTWNVTLTNPPAAGDRYEVTIPVTNATGYFRLRSP